MNKKLLIYILTICIMLSVPIQSYAGEINDAEAAILGLLSSIYEKDGHYWAVKNEYGDKASNYCMRDDVNLTWDDYYSALSGVYDYIGPEYFNIIGDVPGYNDPPKTEPTKPTPSVPDEPETPSEPDTPEEPVTPSVPDDTQTSTSTSTSKTSTSDKTSTTEDVSSDEPEIELTETVSSNDDTLETTEPESTAVYYPDAIKVPDSYTSSENDAIAAMLKPSKDYSNQEHIKKSFPIGLAAALSVLVVLVGALAVSVVHRHKNSRRR